MSDYRLRLLRERYALNAFIRVLSLCDLTDPVSFAYAKSTVSGTIPIRPIKKPHTICLNQNREGILGSE